MKKLSILFLLLVAMAGGYFFYTSRATAADLSQFRAGRIIDDVIFTDSQSMSTAQIQDFLNQKNSVCLKNFTALSLHDDNGDGVVSDTSTEPYGPGTMTAAQIIKAASDIYRISPKVLLVTLQKENSLITGTNCANIDTALGYGCPDTAPCNDAAKGFTRQIDYGSYHFRGYFDDSLNSVPYGTGNQTIAYNPNSACGSSVVNVQNRATAALYNYTPYQPNAAALAAGYGEAPCGAYGNRNFYHYFTDWFGTSLVPNYDYEFVASSAAFINLDYGQETASSITIRNTGNMPWYSDSSIPAGKHPTRISLLNYGATSFADTSDPNWLGTQSQIKMSPAVVNPGENATFSFKLKSPNTSISQTITFVPVVDGVAFMKNVNMQFIAKSTAPKYSYVSSSFAPTQLMPGQKFTSNVVLKNTGNGPWYADGTVPAGKSGMRLASLNYITNPFADTSDPNWLGTQSQIKMSPAVVNPGENATFSFGLAGPAQKTNHNFRFLPVLDGIAFLQDYGMAFDLSDPGQTYSYQFVGVAAPPSTMSPGSIVSTTLQLRNTGGATWKNESTRTSAQTALRLIMAKPWYRSSLFYNSSDPNWINASQIAMSTPEVAPGQVGTFTFTWKAPATKGTYIEYFAPVADGVTLLQDFDMGYKVTVQ